MRYDALSDTCHPAESLTNQNYVYPPDVLEVAHDRRPFRRIADNPQHRRRATFRRCAAHFALHGEV